MKERYAVLGEPLITENEYVCMCEVTAEDLAQTLAENPELKADVFALLADRPAPVEAAPPIVYRQCICEHALFQHVAGHGCTARVYGGGECECNRTPDMLAETAPQGAPCSHDWKTQASGLSYCHKCGAWRPSS